ncbi:3957_t:CDS:2, partial [Gigaspora margarita]
EYRKARKHPLCPLGEINHYRYKSDTCKKCCKKARCNNIICLEQDIECKWSLFKTNKKYKKYKNIVSFCKAKFERTKQDHLHFHNYMQFNNRTTINIVKAMFDNNEEIIFSPGKYCKYSFFDLNNLEECPFEFGKYRFLSSSSNETVNKINNIILENYEKQKAIINNDYSYKDVITNRSKWPITFASIPQNLEKAI